MSISKRRHERRPHKKSWFTLYWEYLPVYRKIEKNPALKKHMKDHPGYKWMKHASKLWWLVFLFLYFLGTYK